MLFPTPLLLVLLVGKGEITQVPFSNNNNTNNNTNNNNNNTSNINTNRRNSTTQSQKKSAIFNIKQQRRVFLELNCKEGNNM
jgi:hypothetical protein